MLAPVDCSAYNYYSMEKPQIDQAFAEMTELMDFDTTGDLLESAEGARQALLNDLCSQLLTFGDIDTDNEDEMTATVDVLTEALVQSLEECEGLDFGDEIVAYGDSIVIIVNEGLGVDFSVLSEGTRLRGAIVGIGVFDIPVQNELSRLCSPDPETEQGQPVKINNFGAVLQIEGALITSDEDEEAIDESQLVLLPLNYPQLKLFRKLAA